MSGPTLAGRLLVATPGLRDPNFVRTVVFLLEAAADGAVGVVLNRPSTVPVDTVLPGWAAAVTGHGVLHQGGPVGLEGALGVALAAEGSAGFRPVLGGVGLLDLDTPQELVAGSLRALRVFAGYSGWGAGQLEDELAEGAWYVVDALPGDVFTDDPAGLWRAVLRRQGGDLALVSTWTDDPDLN
ncbi:MAG: YqgE/AlgH family protein [Actinomycetia bacterium]|jgi:putative transcriptional regulator|nr:YqgE/AlgH family protein [Actinomycetes bacterium]